MATYKSIIPSFATDSLMGSNSNNVVKNGFTASASNVNVSPAFAFGASINDLNYYRSVITPSLPEYLTCTFPSTYKVARYTIELGKYHTSYSNMASWDFEGLVNGSWVVLHSGTNPTATANTLTFDITPTLISGIRIKCKTRYGTNSWGVDELTVYELVTANYALIKDKNIYKSYSTLLQGWEIVTSSTPTLSEFQNGNKPEEIAQIPESAWAELTGEVELLCYTDDTSIEEVQFNVETEPFTLAEELKGKGVSVIEYTDNPTQEEAIVEIETEPFDFYHEVGDSFDVLYYTDNPDSAGADLSITANYSPLDEFEDSVTLVTMDDSKSNLNLNITAIPEGEFIKQEADIKMSAIADFTLSATLGGNSILRILASFDSGATWKAFDGSEWNVVDSTKNKKVIKDGMTADTFNSITDWQTPAENGTIRFAYYLEIKEVTDVLSLDKLSYTTEALASSTPELKGITIKYEDTTLEGRLKDLERINAINLAKLNFKANALLLSDKYKMHDMIVDTMESEEMVTIEGAEVVTTTTVPFTNPVALDDFYISELDLSNYLNISKVEV